MHPEFAHVEGWIFDLDNTLYPRSARLFDQIERKMTAYVMAALRLPEAEADHLREHYWRRHGTTLAGLMREHEIDPGPYLDEVHDIDLSALRPDPALAARIRALPGRKIVYTNGPRIHAQRVCAARGLGDVFDALYGIAEAGFHPKPDAAAFDRIIAQDGIRAATAAMFEDDARNLAVPFGLGMRTVLIGDDLRGDGDHVQFRADDLGAFLAGLDP